MNFNCKKCNVVMYLGTLDGEPAWQCPKCKEFTLVKDYEVS